jgi:anaerobic ribonucleoside-triphosphate reductase
MVLKQQSYKKERKEKLLKHLLPRVKTSKNTEELFDPKRIEKSLIKETELTPEQANEVAIELTRRVISYKIEILTSPEIREMICSILLEKNYDKARFNYTRLGLPFYDFNELISSSEDEETKKEKVYKQIKYEYTEIKKILKDLTNTKKSL